MKNHKRINFVGIALLALVAVTLNLAVACKKKKEENELITKVKVVLVHDTTTVGTFVWSDPDGDGGNPPLPADTITLDSGIIYKVSILFADESNGKNKDITADIRTESTDHLVCYTSTPGGIHVTLTDSDGKYPIGLESQWNSQTKGNFKMRIILRHQPGVKNGTCDPGDTDADVEFPLICK